MNYWHQISMVRLVIAFIIGIVVAILLGVAIHIPLYISLSLFFIYSAFVFWSRLFSNYKYRWLHGVIISISLLLLGFEWTLQNTEKYDTTHIGNIVSDSSAVIIGTLTEPINERENSYRSTLKVSAIQQNNQWIKANGNVMLYFAKDSFASQLQYGDEVLINTKITEVKPPQNPNEFDYKTYLSNKSIYHQAYLKSGYLKVLAHNNGNPILSYSIYLQSKLLDVLKNNHIEGNEYAVASAMLLGSRDKIDADLLNAYSGSGAVHILSVSGLHVGLVFLLLNYLLFFMDKNKYAKLFKIIILLGFIWFYAAITGFSAAVLRSTAMFTFIVLGQAYSRKVNGFNTLAASLFFLLIINPYLITYVGFQLSYLAVIGIMAIYPSIYKLYNTNNWLFDKAWALISVSLAAQIITAPLAMFYFHQFPNMFLITNLIIIPLTTLIMYVGMGFYVISFVPVISAWVSKLLAVLVYLLNETVKFIEHLPYAVSRNISITESEMFLIFAMILLLVTFFYSKQKKYIFLALIVAIFISIFNIIDKTNHLNNRKFIIYSINHHSVYDFIDGTSDYLISDAALLKDDQKIAFHIKNNWCALGINKNNYVTLYNSTFFQSNFSKSKPIFIKNNFIQFYDKRFVIVNDKNCQLLNTEKFKTDYLIIANNAKVTIKEIIKQYSFSHIIIDSSNAIWRTNKWLEECKQLNIVAYAVNNSGAFVISI